MVFVVGHQAYGGFETRFKKGHSLRVGMKHTEESIEKISDSRKGKATGSGNAMVNPEYRKRVSEAKKGTPHYNQREENHPNFCGISLGGDPSRAMRSRNQCPANAARLRFFI